MQRNGKKTPETRGRKRKTTARQDRDIIKYAKRAPFMTSTQIVQDLNLAVSTSLVRRKLIQANLKARSPRKVPLLNKTQVKKRISFAKGHKNWPASKWRNVLWTDESKVVLFGSSGTKNYVRRPPLTEFKPQYTTKSVKHGGCSVMVWGCFSWYGIGPIFWIQDIMNADVYVDILDRIMLPFAEEEMPLRWVFMQDNDPKHTSRKAKQWFDQNKVDVMTWPPQSPDLNPIEHLWIDVKKAVFKANPRNKQQLWETIKVAWTSIPISRCRNLVDSMPRRCQHVLKNKGQATKY